MCSVSISESKMAFEASVGRPAPRLLDAQTLRRCVEMDTTSLGVVETAFSWLAQGKVEMPPIQHLSVFDGANRSPIGDVDIKSAYVRGLDHFAIKIASGFFGNAALGLPSGSGLMVVLSAKTGFCEAILLDEGYLTDLRTALAGAVAAKCLAPRMVRVAGIVGTGRQAAMQACALHMVRPFERLLVYGRNADKAGRLAMELSRRLGVEARASGSIAELVVQSQCVVTTTPSQQPLVEMDMLHPGLHITAMGSDVPGKQELDPEILRRADLTVVDRRAQSERLGELQHVPEEVRESLSITELGEITSGSALGRRRERDVTVCDLTGTGVQDTAIAVYALEVCSARLAE